MVLLDKVLGIFTAAATLGGGLWLIWGAVVLAGGLKDKNGPAIQAGIWQIVGGGVILSAALLFSTLDTDLSAVIETMYTYAVIVFNL